MRMLILIIIFDMEWFSLGCPRPCIKRQQNLNFCQNLDFFKYLIFVLQLCAVYKK
jgi:hypothetical protein